MTSQPTAVLVHGALTDASVWHPVLALLQAAEIPATAPALPMRTFDEDAAAVRSVLDAVEGPVVLVAHSYAGSVISAPQAVTDAVRALVFVAAFQQDAGETAAGLNGLLPGSELTPENLVVRPYLDGHQVTLRPERFASVYAADVSPAHAAVMAAAQHAFDPATLGGSFTGSPSWSALPSWSVVSTADRSIPTRTLRFMAERAGSRIVEVESSHAVPLSHPDVVAATIIAAVQSVASIEAAA
ncbi:alpha/beta hydrolase [Rathayibacter sp. YIM 133350]|uniref:alpha/beta fold hydrolase n=1 Tax=Rathayibacter sp. YIM 133350 TaxID=3131992 RepID=UPI00307DEB1E